MTVLRQVLQVTEPCFGCDPLVGINDDSAMPVVVQAFHVENGAQFRLTRSKEDTGLHGLV
jgi:hypothetical protein